MLFFSVSVVGEVPTKKIVKRSGASQGDAICVTGDLGAALAGLRILMREKTFWEKHGDQSGQPDLGDYKYVVEQQLMPKARLDVIKTFGVHEILPTSMIDLTKGVIKVTQLCLHSNLGAHLYQALQLRSRPGRLLMKWKKMLTNMPFMAVKI